MTGHKSEGMKDLNVITGRKSCTYAEAIVLAHRVVVQTESCSLTPLQFASALAVIFERETVTVFDDIKRGMVP